MRFQTGLLATAFLCSASTLALAQQTSGPYLGIGGGLNLLRDADLSAPGFNTTAEFDPGWAALGALGYGFGNGLRLELELGYRSNDIDGISPGTFRDGKVDAWSAMINALYDIPTGLPVTPYIGAGIGYARVRVKDFNATVGATTIAGDEHDNVFAYQGIVGVSYGITPNLKLGLDYRYFATQDPEFDITSGATLEGEYKAHTVMLGLRWEFGAPRPQPAQAAPPPPPPPPPPSPPPAPVAAPPPPPAPPAIQRSFLVFFDFDRANVTTEAERVIREAASNARRGNVSRINVTGHADRSGSDQYNVGISTRRADAVKAVLVREGVPADQIVVIGRGEAQPLVPTPDGAREPQNRRVEIVLQ